MFTTQYEFNALDADILLISCEPSPTKFRVHRCVLSSASPFFALMFTLPQEEILPAATMSETDETLDALLRFIYPIPDPEISTLEQLIRVLEAALKYDFETVVTTLRNLLVSPVFLSPASATRIFAIASRFELESEAKTASSFTLSTDLLRSPLNEDLKHITAYDYHQLLTLHRSRASAAVTLLEPAPEAVKCMQCNGGAAQFLQLAPKWWIQFERAAREELAVRPSSDVVFNIGFLASAAFASGCVRCPASVLDATKYLEELKRKVDDLPATI